MTLTKAQTVIARRIAREIPDIDEQLPNWARRNNPIVRRQLGIYWRVFPPQPGPVLKWLAIQSGLLLLTILYPVLFVMILTFLLAAITILPYAFWLYVQALGHVANESTSAMADEFRNETLTLLRTTPFSAREIILSKIAASVWRRMDDLDYVISLALVLGMPAIALFYLTTWPPNEVPVVAQGLTIIMMASSLIRLPLEMFMVASVGTMMGAAVHNRSTALLSTLTLVFFYFLLINLARLLTLSWPMQLIVDSVLPILFPIVISWLAVRLTLHLVTRD